jgi:hypothetical protein
LYFKNSREGHPNDKIAARFVGGCVRKISLAMMKLTILI